MVVAGLRQKLAEFGFESNDDFEFVLRCLFDTPATSVRLLNPVGESGRRKTAFGHALAHALEYPHLLYHDFARPAAPAPATYGVDEQAAQDGSAPAELPLTPFERVVTEACAFSEGARTVLILDQLQAADFQDQIRLYHFVASSDWLDGRARAHRRNLLLVAISEQPLYHSLAKLALRVWTDGSSQAFDYQPAEFGWPASASGLFAALGRLFEQLGQAPTQSETRRLLVDLSDRVRTAEQLRLVLYGRIEGLERARLYDPRLVVALQAVIEQIELLVGVDEIVVEARDLLD